MLCGCARLIKPGSVVQARGIDHKRVVSVPMTHGISVKPGVGEAPGVYLRGEFSSVHPNIAPDPLLSIENDHAVRNRFEPHLPSGTHCLREKITRKPQRITDLVRIVSAPRLGQRLWLILLECASPAGVMGGTGSWMAFWGPTQAPVKSRLGAGPGGSGILGTPSLM